MWHKMVQDIFTFLDINKINVSGQSLLKKDRVYGLCIKRG